MASTEKSAEQLSPREQDREEDNAKGAPQSKKRKGSSIASLFSRGSDEKTKQGCPDYFGVRSYLHHFYETHVFKDPKVYEEDADSLRYLLNPRRRRRRCSPIWWKVCVWIGANLLFFGIVGILVGYLVPQRPVIVEVDNARKVAMVDRGAEVYNNALDTCKVTGLVLFCVGGTIFAMSLLFPSFLANHCEDEWHEESAVDVRLDEKRPLSPIEMTIPATSKLKNVQPDLLESQDLVAVRD